MKFVPTDQLKTGMRLAKPIYNKKGVMLYERDSKLTAQSIKSIENFGLIGIYILEQAEPLPPMTEEDREFERFQTVAVFTIREILSQIQAGVMPLKLETLVAEITKNYGRNNKKLSFMQNLRSSEDNVYKHSLNVAILAAAITSKMTMTASDQRNVITAAIIHDIGSLSIPAAVASKSAGDITDNDKALMVKCRDEGYRMLRENCDFDSAIMKNVSYLLRDIKDIEAGNAGADKRPTDIPVEILKVAYLYDIMTAMKLGEEPHSDIAAYKELNNPEMGLSRHVVFALAQAINIAPPGCTVEFENKTKGIVLTENADDVLRPFVLSFEDNKIYNLADSEVYKKYKIKDVLKTLDNRYVMTDQYDQYLERLNSGQEKQLFVGKAP